MAKFRYAVLENDKAITSTTTSGTETIDLPETGILSEVEIQIRCARSDDTSPVLPFFHILTKVELLVDGSTVVKSLSGRQIRALMYYGDGPFGIQTGYMYTSSSNKAYGQFILYLGRFQGDTKYGLDLSRYSNPQLKLTWDTTLTSIDGITYQAAGSSPTFTYNIMCKILDGIPAGFTNKYIQSREIDSYNPAASGETNTEIPRGYPLRGIMLGSRYDSKAWYSAMDHVKLDFDNGKWLPIDMDYENLAAAFRSWYPKPCEWGGWIYLASADNIDTRMLQYDTMTCGAVTTGIGTIARDGFEFPLYEIAIVDHDNVAISHREYGSYIHFTGFGPHQTIYIPMSQLLDGAQEAIDTTQYGRIDFKVTTSGYSASATTRVVAEYEKPNGQ